MTEAPPFELRTETRGHIPTTDVEYAQNRVRAAASASHEPILFARLRLTQLPDPAVPRPFVAQCNLDVNGRLVRAQAAEASCHEAVHHMVDRLRIRLERTSRDWEAQRGTRPMAEPHEWRHTSPPSEHPPYFPRPREEREVIRHKSYTLARRSADQAIADMLMFDYGFHLFTEVTTGQDSVVYRADDGYRIAQTSPDAEHPPPISAPSTVSEHPAPRLTVPEAVERLELTGLPFVFFAEATTGRGNVLYHRYDGHYGLIEPAR